MLNKFSAVWTQIAETFADYDQHLVFESMNEVMIGESYGYTSSLAYENINALNQTFVNAVRSVDGNSDRCLLIPGYNTNIDLTISGLFKISNAKDFCICKWFKYACYHWRIWCS